MLNKNHAKEMTKDNCWTPIESLNMTKAIQETNKKHQKHITNNINNK